MQVRGFPLPIGDFRGKSKGKSQNAKVKSRDRSMRAAFSSGSRNLHRKARKKGCSAGLAVQPCGFSTATRIGRRGPKDSDCLMAARQEPAPLEEPQGRSAGPALQGRKFLFSQQAFFQQIRRARVNSGFRRIDVLPKGNVSSPLWLRPKGRAALPRGYKSGSPGPPCPQDLAQ